jgi:hypothetical protein
VAFQANMGFKNSVPPDNSELAVIMVWLVGISIIVIIAIKAWEFGEAYIEEKNMIMDQNNKYLRRIPGIDFY